MKKKVHKKYDEEFKRQAVELVISQRQNSDTDRPKPHLLLSSYKK
jgi:hypothetical protein